MDWFSSLDISVESDGEKRLSGIIFLGSKHSQYADSNLLYYREKFNDWSLVGRIDSDGDVSVTEYGIPLENQSHLVLKISPEEIELGSQLIPEVEESSYSPVGSTSSRTEENPIERYLNGIWFGILIALQVLATPVLLLAFLLHPFLAVAKALRVFSSALLMLFMIYATVTWDLAMLALYVVTFGFARTEKFVITGYTKELYSWIVGGDSIDYFWDLE